MSETEEFPYLKDLNEPQKEGVLSVEGPSMIIAGAGSGKTRVLTTRIAHLIKKHSVDPFSILSLTFTNKAAKEMRGRIEQIVGGDARNLWMGTFHSVFSRILRAEAHKLGFPSHFTIYDSDDTKSLLRAIVKEFNLDDKVYKANVVYSRISGAKNRLVSWQEYTSNPIYMQDDIDNRKPEMGRIYKEYVQRCFKADAMDFDDLLFYTNVLFRDHIDVLNKYQQRFQYVLVDEFQDTNVSQYVITKKLASVRRNICVVGDDAQSIYAFRGANIQNILNFEKDYPELKVIKLEQNYRSTKNIVNAANSVIGRNKSQLQKSVWTDNNTGELIDVIRATTDNEEGKLVASAIFEDKVNNQLHNSDFAILYRTNSQSRSMEEALRRNNIKYRIVGGVSFYQRKEIKDVLSYIRYAVNQNDEQAFRRIINLPKRGIGDSSVDKLMVAAAENNITVWEVMQQANKYLSGRIANAIADFVTLIKGCILAIEKKDAFEAASQIAKNSGLLKELYDDKTIEGRSRYENVQELLNGIKEFVDNPETEDKSMASFLQEIALLTDADSQDKNDTDFVTLMTIHMAKGLEFKHVYLVGMEEDLFPSQMMLSSRDDLEEERRLFYVAITRAEIKLTLSYALTRYRFGSLKTCEPSRFLEEIDKDFIRVSQKYSNSFTPPALTRESNHTTRSFISNVQSTASRPSPNAIVHKPSANFAPSDTSGLAEGMKVEHPKFGFGTVTKMEVQGTNRKAHISFEKAGDKTLLLSFAKLRVLG
ncbi:UvrD-helicase domain-containing protein [Reichenbachiella sp. MALMAid0571]|uniref:ATP-dependent helicase n=1 Tax=Reichenbachiella sp. MALMAid0571 TaxID=3143939 RepID=UPI0032E00C93